MTAETSNARGAWVLVPREPTKAMIDAWRDAPDIWEDAYAAMLAAAPQSPAEAQPVAKLVNRKDADGGKTTTFIRPTSLGMDLPLGEYPLHLHPPPSAHVGVEGLLADLETIWHSVSDDKETNAAYQRLKSALTQQPAAVGENRRLANALQSLLRYVERCREAGVLVCDDIGPEEFARHELAQALSLPPEQPAAVDEAMVERAWVAFCEDTGPARAAMRAALTAALAAQHQGDKR